MSPMGEHQLIHTDSRCKISTNASHTGGGGQNFKLETTDPFYPSFVTPLPAYPFCASRVQNLATRGALGCSEQLSYAKTTCFIQVYLTL
jgi:hypothetical protein